MMDKNLLSILQRTKPKKQGTDSSKNNIRAKIKSPLDGRVNPIEPTDLTLRANEMERRVLDFQKNCVEISENTS